MLEVFCCQDDHWMYHNTSLPCNHLDQGATSGYQQMLSWAEHQFPSQDVTNVFNESLLNFMIKEQLWMEAAKSDADVEIFWMGMKLNPANKLNNPETASDVNNPLSSMFLDRLQNRKAHDHVCVEATAITNDTTTFANACWSAYLEVLSKPSVCINEWTSWSDCVDGMRTRERGCAVRETGCITYPEIGTGTCELLELIFPENDTIIATPGERLRMRFRAKENPLSTVMFQLPYGPASATLTTDGTFDWLVPSGTFVDEDIFVNVLLYNNDGHQRNINLTVEIISCPCVGGYGVCVERTGVSQGLGVYDCDCEVGRFGTLCEEDVNECESDPCHPMVDCINLHNMYWCTACPDGYHGDGISCKPVTGNRGSENTNGKDDNKQNCPVCDTGRSSITKSMSVQLLIIISMFSYILSKIS
ncbi:von Willebrand factor D and EGF domain-containing protein-like [Anneissia japonica]|uniref:von Willebrand factor D and EGF domain-containing protein-like n=1 Tax=Anneissia japonica TaxID=1529436 RepID=UPI001425628E|nr:von Willebrand factor D and EGF domain-containing protein-like [Anneissia japonica]